MTSRGQLGALAMAALAASACRGTKTPAPPAGTPILTVLAPGEGEAIVQGLPQHLSATATDREDGVLTARIAWSDDRGDFTAQGGQPTVVFRSGGPHLVTATVSDAQGHRASLARHVTVAPSGSPLVSILAPLTGSSVARGQAVDFAAFAVDADGSDISARVTWTDAAPGGGADVAAGQGATWTAALATPGLHTITATVQGSKSSASAAVQLEVTQDHAPVVAITAPADGAYEKVGRPFAAAGTATDADECPGADCLGSAIAWTLVDPAGHATALGSGAGLSAVTLASAGAWQLVAAAADHASPPGVGRAVARLTAVDNLPPVCAITSPAPDACGLTFAAGAAVTFVGGCTDPDNPAGATVALAPSSLHWRDLNAGLSAGGASATFTLSSPGTHQISLCADDAETTGTPQPGCAEVTVTVVPNGAPSCALAEPAAGAVLVAGEPFAVAGSASDPEDPGLTCAQPRWRVAFDGDFGQAVAAGSGAAVAAAPLAAGSGAATVDLEVSDSGGLTATCSAPVFVDHRPTATLTAVTQNGQDCAATGCLAGAVTLVAGEASDPDPGDAILGWRIVDSVLGELASCGPPQACGAPAASASLPVGRHRLALWALDGHGAWSALDAAPSAPGQGNLVEVDATASGASWLVPEASDPAGALAVESARPGVAWLAHGGLVPGAVDAALVQVGGAQRYGATLGGKVVGLAAIADGAGERIWAAEELDAQVCALPLVSSTASCRTFAGAAAAAGGGRLTAVAQGGGVLALGTDTGAALLVDENGGVPATDASGALVGQGAGLASGPVNAIAPSASVPGAFWIAGDGGLALWSWGATSPERTIAAGDENAQALGTTRFLSVAEAGDGSAVYLGTDRGLAVVAIPAWTASWVELPAVEGLVVQALALDRQSAGDVLWIGAGQAGLVRWDTAGDPALATSYGVADGLPDPSVWSLALELGGAKWIGTPQGVVRVVLP